MDVTILTHVPAAPRYRFSMTGMSIKQTISDVQAKLLPLPLFVKFLERLLMLLPRTHCPVELEPEGDLKPLDIDKGEWEATGVDPRFRMRIGQGPLRAGWYYLEAALTRHSGNRVAKIYFDQGRGLSERNSVFVPSNRRGSVREVLHLPGGIRTLRWDPTESPGYLSQSPLIVHRITRTESLLRRVWRVLFDLWRFRSHPPHARAGLTVRRMFQNLGDAYARSASLRRTREAAIAYDAFLRRNDNVSNLDYRAIADDVRRLRCRPLISIVMPVYNPPLGFFREALDSVIAQSYPHWELCLADDASTRPDVRRVIEEYRRKDSRIKAVFRPVNGHISTCSNSALEIATGEFVALVDQDDLIPQHALYHVAVEINRHPTVDLIYSDEDKIDESGKRVDPYFKSDWNPDLFLSQNMFNHLGVFRASLLRKVGAFRAGYEGSQDYDLTLRCVANTTPDRIRHIPRVLYHWRIHAESTALSHDAKSYARDNGLKALQSYLQPYGAQAEPALAAGMYRVRYPLPSSLPLVTLIIPTRDQAQLLRQCIESIEKKTDYRNWEILVIDNQSREPATLRYFESLSKDRRIRVLKYDAPFNYSAINNFGARHANGSILGLINNDVEVISQEWLSEMVSHVLRPGIGAVGARLLYSDTRVQHAGVVLGIGGVAGHAHKFFDSGSPGYFARARLTQNVAAVTAACLLIRKAIFDQVDGLDEKNLTVAFNDVDFCLKVHERGYRNVYTPYAVLFHHESVSRGQEDTPQKQARFTAEVDYMKARWGRLLERDPYYNPNLTLLHEDFSLAEHEVVSPHHGYPLAIPDVKRLGPDPAPDWAARMLAESA